MGIRVFTLMLLGGVSLYNLPALAGKNIYPNASSSKPPLQTRVETGVRAGTDRSLATTEFWVPIAQNMVDGSVVYGDLRLMGDDQENQEFNLGVGYREMVNNALNGEGIVGAHLWFDKRLTDGGSSFNQVTLRHRMVFG